MTRLQSRESSWMLVFPPHIYSVMGFCFHICIVSWCIIIVYRCGKTHCDKIGVRLVLPPSRCLPRICLNTKGIRGRHLFQSQPWILPFFLVCLVFARCLSHIVLLGNYEVDTKEIRSKYELVFASRPLKGRHLFACRQIRGRHQANTRQRPISKKKLLVSEYARQTPITQKKSCSNTLTDWCFVYYSVRNRLVALLEALNMYVDIHIYIYIRIYT